MLNKYIQALLWLCAISGAFTQASAMFLPRIRVATVKPGRTVTPSRTFFSSNNSGNARITAVQKQFSQMRISLNNFTPQLTVATAAARITIGKNQVASGLQSATTAVSNKYNDLRNSLNNFAQQACQTTKNNWALLLYGHNSQPQPVLAIAPSEKLLAIAPKHPNLVVHYLNQYLTGNVVKIKTIKGDVTINSFAGLPANQGYIIKISTKSGDVTIPDLSGLPLGFNHQVRIKTKSGNINVQVGDVALTGRAGIVSAQGTCTVEGLPWNLFKPVQLSARSETGTITVKPLSR